MNFITRFAPSPTGYLHIGNTRTALICYLSAKANNGKLMLRLDDTDPERSKQEYADIIQDNLKWLGIEWDLFAKQSERMDRYKEIIEKLKEMGRLYPCFETKEELDIKRKMQIGRGLPPIYDREALKLTEDEIKNNIADGKTPHWRFKLNYDKPIQWNDLIKGKISFSPDKLSDPILIRECGTPTYMLPSAIDDIDFNITHVVRGDDHVSNTAIQIQLFEAIGKAPEFAHHSLIKSKDGKISKRIGGFDINSIKDSEIEPMVVNSFLAKIGTSNEINIEFNMEKLINDFDFNKFSKNSVNYSFDDIERLNSKFLHQIEFNDIKDKIDSKIEKNFWDHVSKNIEKLSDINEWWKICNEELQPEIKEEDKEFLKEIINFLPENINEDSWQIWINSIKSNTDRKGKNLFMPIRLALTASELGPELKHILPLMSREKIISRLSGNKS